MNQNAHPHIPEPVSTRLPSRLKAGAPAAHRSRWIGSVSWAKAGDAGDVGRWVPAPVARVSELVEGAPRVLTRGLAKEITVALNLPDRSHYRTWTHPRPRNVKRFLAEHIGDLVFGQSE